QEVGQKLSVEGERAAQTELAQLKAEAVLQSRREAVDRADLINSFNQKAQKLFTDADAQADLSREGALVALGQGFDDLENEARQSFQGSDVGRLILEERLSVAKGGIIGRATERGRVIGQKKVEATIGGYINSARTAVTFDPDSVDGHITNTLRRAQEDFGAFDPTQERLFNQSIPATLGSAAITSYIMRGKFGKAEALMQRPDMAAAIGEVRLKQLTGQLGAARAAIAKAALALRSKDVKGVPRDVFDALPEPEKQRLLGTTPKPQARILSDKETKDKGFEEGTVVQVTVGKGGTEKFEILQKPEDTLKEIEDEAAARERGKLGSRLESMQSILATAGAPP
ncbi:hypothetical protein LCGC14_3120820, partial [marine sediment metagenome]